MKDKVHKDFNAFGPQFIEQRSGLNVRRTGSIKTKYGIVIAKSWISPQHRSSWFCFIWDSKCHSRYVEDKAYTDRGLIRVARQFAKSIAESGASK